MGLRSYSPGPAGGGVFRALIQAPALTNHPDSHVSNISILSSP